MKILVNDGFEDSGINALKHAGFEVDSNKIPQDELVNRLSDYQGIIIRSATKIRKEQIDAGKNLKFIARAGVGIDNIDAEYARSKGIQVINTPGASSRSVAELAMAHILGLTRSLQLTNRSLKDAESFNKLKKQLSTSTEVKNKTIALLGLGRIGSELARMALGLEMNVIVVDPFLQSAQVQVFVGQQVLDIPLRLMEKMEALSQADYISLHAPFNGEPILGKAEFESIKPGSILINTSRGENINEEAMLNALNSGRLLGAGLDVFHNEPHVNPDILNHPNISFSPHIAASTKEAQARIAEELVGKIVKLNL